MRLHGVPTSLVYLTPCIQATTYITQAKDHKTTEFVPYDQGLCVIQ